MRLHRILVAGVIVSVAAPVSAQRAGGAADTRPEVAYKTVLPKDDARVSKLKRDVIALVDSMSKFTQQMVDQVFSFGELGFQEFETSKYLTGGIL